MKWYWLIVIVLALAARFYVSTLSYNGDMNNHFVWVQSLKEQGFKGFYSRDYSPFAQANYPPLINVSFYGSQLLAEEIGLFDKKLIFAIYKIPAVLIETVAFVMLGAIFSPLLLLILLINPGIFYNTLLWGQTEGLVASLIVISLFFTDRKRVFISWLFFVLALLVKQSAVIFLPLILIYNLKSFGHRKNIYPLILAIVFFVVLFIPFYGKEFIAGAASFLSQQTGGQQAWGSVNALNLWYLVGKNQTPDNFVIFSLSIRTLGIMLTGIFYVYFLSLAMKIKPSFKNSLILAGMMNLAVFLFMTRIHERHLLPSLLFLSVLALESYRGFLVYAIISMIGFYNMYLIWQESFRTTNFTTLALLSVMMILSFIFITFGLLPKVFKTKRLRNSC